MDPNTAVKSQVKRLISSFSICNSQVYGRVCQTTHKRKQHGPCNDTCGDKRLKFWNHSGDVAKSIADVARNIETENRLLSISELVLRMSSKALEINQELLKMCKEAKFDFIDHKNINPRTHLNKNRLDTYRNGSVIMGKNF